VRLLLCEFGLHERASKEFSQVMEWVMGTVKKAASGISDC